MGRLQGQLEELSRVVGVLQQSKYNNLSPSPHHRHYLYDDDEDEFFYLTLQPPHRLFLLRTLLRLTN